MPTHRLDIRRFSPLLAMFVLLLLAAAPAQADVTKIVNVTMDWRIGKPTGKDSTCASFGIAAWPAQKGATSWEILYNFNGEPRSEPLFPPFDDDEFGNYGWAPAKGVHWHSLTYSGSSSFGGNPVTCDENQANQKALYSNARLRVTTGCLLNRAHRLWRQLNAARKRERLSYRASKRALRRFLSLQRRLKGREGRVLRGFRETLVDESRKAKLRAKKLRAQAAHDRRQRQRLQRHYRKDRDKCL